MWCPLFCEPTSTPLGHLLQCRTGLYHHRCLRIHHPKERDKRWTCRPQLLWLPYPLPRSGPGPSHQTLPPSSGPCYHSHLRLPQWLCMVQHHTGPDQCLPPHCSHRHWPHIRLCPRWHLCQISGGTMALLCTEVNTDKNCLLGYWHSNEMLRYPHIQAYPLTATFAHQMLLHGNFALIPNNPLHHPWWHLHKTSLLRPLKGISSLQLPETWVRNRIK